MRCEPLEGRALLTSVLISNLNEMSISAGTLGNELTISVDALGTYTFSDPSETFSVVNNGSATYTGDGTHTLQVSGIVSINVLLADGDDTINLRSTNIPVTINTGAGQGDVINVGSLAPATGGVLSGIQGVVQIDDDDYGLLNIDDSGDATGRTIAVGELGNQTVIAVSGTPNLLVGTKIGNVHFTGGNGDDSFAVAGLLGSTLVDLNGGGGNDSLTFSPLPLVNLGQFDGGTGTNSINYSLLPLVGTGVAVDLAAGTATGMGSVANVQQVTGSPGNDTLQGSAGANTLVGGDGDDSILGLGGDDQLDGNGGDDTIVGGTGNDIMNGNADNDLLVWNNGDNNDTMNGGTGDDIVQVNGSTGATGDQFLFQVNPLDPTSYRFDRSNLIPFNLIVSNTDELQVNGLAGDDTLTLDFAGGNPILAGINGGPGIVYDGGTGGGDSLTLQRSSGTFTAATEEYTATGASSGVVRVDANHLSFSNLAPINDTVPAINLTVNLPAGPNQANIINGPTVSGFATTQVSSGDVPAGFELINFANKTSATINADADDDAITLDNATPADGLTNLTINGLGGNDQYNIVATGSGVGYVVNCGSGNDLVTTSYAALASGSTYVLNGGTGVDQLIVDAGDQPVDASTPGIITLGTPSTPGFRTINYSSFESITINNANNTPPVPGTPREIDATEGLNLVDALVATFTDTDPDAVASEFVATIAWGDGSSSAGQIVQDASDPSIFYVLGTHLYADDGSFVTTTTVVDLGTSTTTTVGGTVITINQARSAPVPVPGSAVVGDAPITSQGTPITGVEGTPLTSVLVAAFQTIDPNATAAGFTAQIAWGDGTTSNGVITSTGATPNGVTFQVTGTHTYADNRVYPVTISIVSAGGSTATSGTTAVIGDAPVSVTGLPIIATAGTPVQDAVATFTTADPNALIGEFTAEIVWGDGSGTTAGIISGVAPDFTVTATHAFSTPGSYDGIVIVHSLGGAVGTAAFTSQVAGLTETCATVPAVEDVPLNNVVLATFASAGGPPPVGSYYNATIDWGDATPRTPGYINPATLEIVGSHTYEESGNYTIQITIGTYDNPGLLTSTCPITVEDVPIILTGRLDPASDSGISNSDGITFVRQPNFFGTSEALSSVTLTAVEIGGGPLIPMGGTTTDLSGNWQLTSQVALADGQYVITAHAVDRNGVTTATTVIATITIDTVGPKVTNLWYTTKPAQITATLQDDRSGLAQQSIIDNRNYKIEKPHKKNGRLLIQSLSATPAATPTDPQTVTAPVALNGKRFIRGGTYTVTIANSPLGITDVAGNPLDGEFYGFFPSGNNVPGGDFVAVVDVIHGKILPAKPTQGYGTPNVPPGTPAVGGHVNPPHHQQQQLAKAKREAAAKARAERQKALAEKREAQRVAQAQQRQAQRVAQAQQRAIQTAQRNAAKPTLQDRARDAAIHAMIGRANWF